MLQSLRVQKKQLPSEELIKQLPSHKTAGNLLRAVKQLAGEETCGALCERVLDLLLEQQKALINLELSRELRQSIDGAAKEWRRRQQSPAAARRGGAAGDGGGGGGGMVPPPPKPSPRTLATGHFSELPGAVEAVSEGCDGEAQDTDQQVRQELRRTFTRSRTYMAPASTTSQMLQLPVLPASKHGSVFKRAFMAFEHPDSSLLSKAVEVIIVLTVIVSTFSFILETMPAFRERPAECAQLLAAGLPLTVRACEPKPKPVFFPIEAVCIVIFTFDYMIRILLAHSERPPKVGILRATLNYARQPMCIIDLLAITPFYLDLLLDGELGFARVLRLARILRLFKLAKRIPMVTMYSEVLVMSGQPLAILMFFNVIIVTVFGALIYYAEGQEFSVDSKFVSDERFQTGVYVRLAANGSDTVVTPFHSIPYSLWWVCVTVTTVGYGDFAPTTGLGKLIGVATFYCGIIFLALPISILGQNFAIVYERYLLMNNNRFPSMHRSTTSGSTRPRSTIVSRTWVPNGSLRRSIFRLLEDPTSSRMSKAISVFMMLAILVSTLSFIFESMPLFRNTPEECLEGVLTVETCEPMPFPVFQKLEEVCIAFFTLDYILRIALVHAATPYECGLNADRTYTGLAQTFGYFRQVLNLIDVFAIIPFYIELAGGGGGGASVLRVLRLVRVFRVLRVPKLKSCAEMFLDVGTDAMPALCILFCMSMLACIFFASCIYFTEGTTYSVDARFLEAYPEGLYIRPTKDGYDLERSPFSSIPYAFWWFFTTATTVGFGDDYPTTTSGRLCAIIVFMASVVLLAMPITIVGGSFGKYYEGWVRSFGAVQEESMDLDDGLSPSESPRSPRSCGTTKLEDLGVTAPHEEIRPLDANGKECLCLPRLTVEPPGDICDIGHRSGESPMAAWT